MKHRFLALKTGVVAVAFAITVTGMVGQQDAAVVRSSIATSAVPRVVNYSGVLNDLNGKPLNGTAGVTFLLYKDEQGGAPLWMETQNVQPDRSGHYTVSLGTTTGKGLPEDVFMSGEARWLGVQIQGQEEKARVLLVAVPYALKAHDAETIGGLPPSAFVLAAPANGGTVKGDVTSVGSDALPPATLTGSGTAGFLPHFTGASTLGNSAVFQSGASPTAKIGINTSSPTATLDVHGAAAVRGTLSLPASAFATAASGKTSQAENLTASAFNSGTSTAVNQTFQLKAEPVNNNTVNASATLNLLFGQGTSAPAETGFRINKAGIVTFAAGQTFPGTGPGTVKSVGSGLGLTGGPITSTGTLSIDTGIVPRLNVANTFSTSQAINGNLAVSGSENFAGPIQFTDGTTPLLINSTNCCSFGNRMIWAHSPSFINWGIFYDDNADVMHFQRSLGNDVMAVSFGGGSLSVASRANVGSSTSANQALIVENNGSAQALQIQNFANPIGGFTEAQFDVNGKATFFTDAFGNTTAAGTKSAAVPLVNGSMVKVFSTESPEVWFEDYGFGKIVGGNGTVTIDPSFTQTASMKGYHVFVTPKGDCKGLYVTNEGPTGFEVRELGGGGSSVEFDYRIVAHRKGYETLRLPLAQLPKMPVVNANAAVNPQLSYRAVAPAQQKPVLKATPKR